MAQKKKIVIEDENDQTQKEPPSTPSDAGADTDKNRRIHPTR
jgi:hypothetical protein